LPGALFSAPLPLPAVSRPKVERSRLPAGRRLGLTRARTWAMMPGAAPPWVWVVMLKRLLTIVRLSAMAMLPASRALMICTR